MTREEAYAKCPSDSYVELYGGQWLVVPFAPVEQPPLFHMPARAAHRSTRHLVTKTSQPPDLAVRLIFRG